MSAIDNLLQTNNISVKSPTATKSNSAIDNLVSGNAPVSSPAPAPVKPGPIAQARIDANPSRFGPGPTPNSITAKMPDWLGGGEYIIDLDNVGNVINTGHSNYGGEVAVKGSQRDDKIPVSLGGNNKSAANIQIQPGYKTGGLADQSDAVEKQVQQDYKDGKITLGQARAKVINFKLYGSTNADTNKVSTAENALTYPLEKLSNIDLLSGLRERVTATTKSIKQKSFEPLKQSFTSQAKSLTPQPEDSKEVKQQKLLNFVLSFGGEGGSELPSRVTAEDLSKRFAAPDFIHDSSLPKLTENITLNEKGVRVPPPATRGGIMAPETDLTKFKDVSAPLLTRDTMERNLEKVAGPEANKINKFLVEPIRNNETARIKFVDNLRTEVKNEVIDKLGIKPGSYESALVQRAGERKITQEELRQAAPTRWQKIEQASQFFRNKYDQLLDQINNVRKNFGYDAIPKRQDYFRHFQELTSYADQFGLAFRNSDLPTAISGLTENFNPGKPFSSAELTRKGGKYTEDAIAGMENYINATSRQIFHTDSVQRARALEKYIRQSAEQNRSIKLPNFIHNLHDFGNLVAGKISALDRSAEAMFGGKVFKAINWLTKRFGANAIAGNISAALTHSIPLNFTIATTEKIPLMRGLVDTVTAPFAKDFRMIDGVESKFLVRRFPKTIKLGESLLDKISGKAGFLFKTVDEFISHLAVAGKYREGVFHGLNPEEAMAKADNYANRVIGDRSTGNLPNIMSSKVLKPLTQFQIEVNDNLSFLIHDIPKLAKGNYLKIASQVTQYIIFAHLYNILMKGAKGAGKGLDPIGLLETVFGHDDVTKDATGIQRAKVAGKELLGELPFSSIVTGQIPAFGNIPSIFSGSTNLPTKLKTIAADFAAPFGGSQIKKSIEGYLDYKKGEKTNNAGKKSFDIPQSNANFIRALLFGPNATSEGQKYVSGLKASEAGIKKSKTPKQPKSTKFHY